MSASAIGDALVTMFGAASAFGATGVSKDDYGVLTSTAGSALIVQPQGFSNVAMTFGAPMAKHVTWEMGVEVYIRDTGDPVSTLRRMWQSFDVVKAVIDGDDTLQGTAKIARLDRGQRARDTYVEAGGATWLPVYMTVLAEEW